jgi:hypothetical protein
LISPYLFDSFICMKESVSATLVIIFLIFIYVKGDDLNINKTARYIISVGKNIAF